MESTKRERSGKILSYTFEEFVSRVKSFHGFEAVGVIVGGFMVDLAYKHLPKKGLFDALCETPKCLPDSIHSSRRVPRAMDGSRWSTWEDSR